MSKEEKDNYNSGKLGDWAKKIALTGMGALFMTEEGVRNLLSEMKLPKNVASAMITQAEKTKAEIRLLFAKEMRQFLEHIEVEKIIKKVLKNQSIDVKISIKLNDKKDK